MSAEQQVGVAVPLATRELFPLPPVIQKIEDNVWSAIEDATDENGVVSGPTEQEVIQEELDRLFGPDNSEGSEYLAGLVLWIRNMEQASANEAALARPFEEEMQRHRRRSRSLENRAKWVRERLAHLVAQRGGRFDAGMHKVHVREVPSAQVIGSCKVHPVEHFEGPQCQGFEVTDQLPVDFARVKVEPRLAELRSHLIAEEAAGREAPRWARLVRRLSAVIR